MLTARPECGAVRASATRRSRRSQGRHEERWHDAGMQSEATRATLLEAFHSLRPRMSQIAGEMERAMGAPPAPAEEQQSREQFFNAFDALVCEALEGSGTEKRAFVLETAIPALVAQGTSPMELVESHVSFFVVLSHHLLDEVAADRQVLAGAWLASFFGGYVREVTERALEAERAL